jgi:hypothetical protein
MNELQAWQQIIEEWKKVDRLRRLNQELYDQLGDVFFYLLKYAEKNNILLPNKEALYRMIDNLHERIHFIYPSSDESYQRGDESDDRHEVNSTLLLVLSP